MVKCSDRNIEKEYGFGFTPILIHFHTEVPNVYRGDLEEEKEILIWLLANLEKSEIEEVCIYYLGDFFGYTDKLENFVTTKYSLCNAKALAYLCRVPFLTENDSHFFAKTMRI